MSYQLEFKNYIVGSTNDQTFPNNGLFAGFVGVAHVVSYSNAGPSHARGLEFNYEQRFKTLPGALGGLGAVIWSGAARSALRMVIIPAGLPACNAASASMRRASRPCVSATADVWPHRLSTWMTNVPPSCDFTLSRPLAAIL